MFFGFSNYPRDSNNENKLAVDKMKDETCRFFEI